MAKHGLAAKYEGPEVLGDLLAQAGSPFSMDEVIARMREGGAAGQAPAEVFPTLFQGEPRFVDAALARRTFENLFGLWESLKNPNSAERVVEELKPPPPFGPEGPTAEFVEAAWRYIEDMADREYTRHLHSFENRQDALLTWLDDSGLSDEGYGVARHLLFELCSMIQLGWPKGLRSVAPAELEGAPPDVEDIPPPLLSYLDEALFESEHDEEAPLPAGEGPKVRQVAIRGLWALWKARKDGGGDGQGQRG